MAELDELLRDIARAEDALPALLAQFVRNEQLAIDALLAAVQSDGAAITALLLDLADG
jgi:hypothetical protein